MLVKWQKKKIGREKGQIEVVGDGPHLRAWLSRGWVKKTTKASAKTQDLKPEPKPLSNKSFAVPPEDKQIKGPTVKK